MLGDEQRIRVVGGELRRLGHRRTVGALGHQARLVAVHGDGAALAVEVGVLEAAGVRQRASTSRAGVRADALAEGISDTGALILDSAGNEQGGPIAEYAVLWEQINGPDSWAANPWVWVVEFRRLP